MNPSKSGWLKKLSFDLKNENNIQIIKSQPHTFYQELRISGFIYGHNINVVHNLYPSNSLSDLDRCKINLTLALKNRYFYSVGNLIDFHDSLCSFYGNSLLSENDNVHSLEDFMHYRISANKNFISKHFEFSITNSFLFTDVILFEKYLKTNQITVDDFHKVENIISNFINDILSFKNNKTAYDERLKLIINDTLNYENETNNYEPINVIEYPSLKNYLTDLGALASWSPKTHINAHETIFKCSSHYFKPDRAQFKNSLKEINQFYEDHYVNIGLLNSDNYIKNFYRNTSQMVKRLIYRNKTRLLTEISESKDLIFLLNQSKSRPLTDLEKGKIKNQLLDIFRSIPSLAIFLLPGGSLLMPLIIKFIPQLLPSSFKDNYIDQHIDDNNN